MITRLINGFAQATCTPSSGGGFFGLPTWYKYLPGRPDAIDPSKCVPYVEVGRLPALVLGILDIALFLGGLVAVVFVMYGGVQYLISQGEPDRTSAAKDTILNAVIGLVVVMMATTIVRFIGSRLG